MSLRIVSALGWIAAVGFVLAGCGSGDEAVAPAGPQFGAMPVSNGENRPPTIEKIQFEPAEPVRGDRIRAVVVARDPDGDATEIGYRWFVDGEAVPASGPEVDLGQLGDAVEIELVAVASDGRSESAEERARVAVVDRPPVIVGLSVNPPETVRPGSLVVADASGRDPDGDPVDVEYEWFVNGDWAPATGNEIASDGLRMGDEIRVRATAVARGVRSESVESDPVRVGSAHPEIVSEPPQMRAGGVFVYDVEAVDPDGDRVLRYRLDAAPEGMTVDPVVGRVEWRPSVDQAGEHQVAVVVRDSSGLETKQSFHVTVSSVESEPPAAIAE